MLSSDGLFFAWYFSKSIYWIVLVWFSLLYSFFTNISGTTIPPDSELKNCLLFSCSTILASNKGAFNPLFNKNFSYSVLENLLFLKNLNLKKSRIPKFYKFNTEEIFENKEQIEVSRFYEKLPKPHAVAVEQWLAEKIYYRHTDETPK